MMSWPKRSAAAKQMEMGSNQDTVNSTIPIICALKTNWKQKKEWRQKQLGVKKESGIMTCIWLMITVKICVAIGLIGETEIFIKDTDVTMAGLA